MQRRGGAVRTLATILAWVGAGTLLGTGAARAQSAELVVRDGSLGPTPPGVVGSGIDPNGAPASYLITPDLGEQRGGNLFHSFSRFGIAPGETATFTGPDPQGAPQSVRNVIARVTGEERSQIDGTLRSTIEGADLYLLNPSGLSFGPGARLDVAGSFHASTADALRMSDGTRFLASLSASSVLAVAEPAAFGFLSDPPASIELTNSALVTPLGKGLSLIGGDLRIDGASQYADGAPDEGLLAARAGRIDLASVASSGEVVPTPDDLDTSSFAALGTLEITGARVISSARLPIDDPQAAPPQNAGAGPIFIRAGRLDLDAAQVTSQTFDNGDGGVIDIRVREDFEADGTFSLDNVGVFAGTGGDPGDGQVIGGSGDAGGILLDAGNVTLLGGARLSATSFASGDGGDVQVLARDSVHISGFRNVPSGGQFERVESAIFSNAQGAGAAGSIQVGTPERPVSRLLLIPTSPDGFDGGFLVAQTTGPSDSGAISVYAERVELRGNGRIDSSTRGAGAGATILVQATDEIMIRGRSDLPETPGEELSGITSLSQPEASGAAGSVSVSAPVVRIADGGEVSATTKGAGRGGDVTIRARNLRLEGDGSVVAARSEGMDPAAQAGTVRILANGRIEILDGAAVTTSSQVADGGNIFVNAGTLELLPNRALEITKTDAQGEPIPPGVLLYLRDASITTSVGTGNGAGGNIAIDPTLLVLDISPRFLAPQGNPPRGITANAFGGPGGNVKLVGSFFFTNGTTPGLLVTASSQLGVPGQVDISTPDVDITGRLGRLPESFLDAAALLRERCAARSARPSGSFVLAGRSGLAPSPDAALPSDAATTPVHARSGALVSTAPRSPFSREATVSTCGG